MTNPPPYDHQREAVAFALDAHRRGMPGALMAHTVGAGKTRTALGVAKGLKAQRVLVLAPVAALGVWTREVAKWWPIAGAQPLRGDDEIASHYEPLVVVTNYDQLIGTAGATRIKKILKWKPQLLIADESQYCASISSQRSRAVHRMSKKIAFRLLLSGTPAHDPLGWYSQMKLIAPGDSLWAASFGDYKRRVAIFGGPEKNWVTGFRQKDVDAVVREHVLPYTHVVDRSRLALPEPVESVVPFALGPEERRMYDNLEKTYVTTLSDGTTIAADHVFARISKMQQVCSGFLHSERVGPPPNSLAPIAMIHRIGLSKLAILKDLLDQRPDHRVVIACHFTQEIDDIVDGLMGQGRGVVIIDGNTDGEQRAAYADGFQLGHHRVVIIQIKAGGVALTLSKADTLIFYGLPSSAIDYQQVRGRIDRPGKPPFQEILVLCAEKTLEEDVYTGLKTHLRDVDLARRIDVGVRSRAAAAHKDA